MVIFSTLSQKRKHCKKIIGKVGIKTIHRFYTCEQARSIEIKPDSYESIVFDINTWCLVYSAYLTRLIFNRYIAAIYIWLFVHKK